MIQNLSSTNTYQMQSKKQDPTYYSLRKIMDQPLTIILVKGRNLGTKLADSISMLIC